MTAAANTIVQKEFREIREQIIDAHERNTQLNIIGGNTKEFLAPSPPAEVHSASHPKELRLLSNSGIVSYQPSELVITVRAGTKLSEVIDTLAEKGQMLGFEPPSFGATATIGGTVASALNGPARPYLGSLRDAVLGIKIMTGTGDIARFGGEVMKNVAGYDVSRLLVGSMGSLAVLLEISLRVQPMPKALQCFSFSCDEQTARAEMSRLRGISLPITGLAYAQEQLCLRLSGAEVAIQHAISSLPAFESSERKFWIDLNEQRLEFFASSTPLWRVTVPFDVSGNLPGEHIWDWGGGLCWVKTIEPAAHMHALVQDMGGAATQFRGAGAGDFSPKDDPIAALRDKLKKVFDPHYIFVSRAAWR